MSFNICLRNHAEHSQQALQDIVRPVSHGLTRNGVAVCFSDALLDDRVNLVVECFNKAFADELLACRGGFGVIATERLIGGVINNDSKQHDRAAHLANVLPHARFVWRMVAGDYEALNANVHEMWLRFDPDSLDAEIDSVNRPLPQFDFTAYGTHTDARQELCEELQRRGYGVSWDKRVVSRADRDEQVRNARYVINFAATGGNGRSFSREWAAIHLRRPLVADQVDTLEAARRHHDWREMAEAQLAIFRAAGTMEEEMGRLLVASGLA